MEILNAKITGTKLTMEDHGCLVFWKDGEPKCKIKRSDFGFEWGKGGNRWKR